MRKNRYPLLTIFVLISILCGIFLLSGCQEKFGFSVAQGDYHEGQPLPEITLTSGKGTIAWKEEDARFAAGKAEYDYVYTSPDGEAKEGKYTMTASAHTTADQANLHVTIKYPTCDDLGIQVSICDICGEEFNRESIDELGHSFTVPVHVDGDCLEKGYTYLTCANECGANQCDEDGNLIKEMDADFGPHAWVLDENGKEVVSKVTIPPTCLAEGRGMTFCKYHEQCGGEKEVAIETCDHDFSEERHTDGDCQTYGYTELFCIYGCGAQRLDDSGEAYRVLDTEYGPHDFSVPQHTAGNCQAYGYTEMTCSLCGEFELDENGEHVRVQDQEYGPHDFSVSHHTPGNCVTKGFTEMSCSVCEEYQLDENGERVRQEDEEYGEHVWILDEQGEVRVFAVIPPTCQDDGSGSCFCAYDNISDVPAAVRGEVRQWLQTPPEGAEHSHAEQTLTLPRVEHDYSAKFYDKYPTCATDGAYHFICVWCGENDPLNETYVDTARPPHHFVNGVCDTIYLDADGRTQICQAVDTRGEYFVFRLGGQATEAHAGTYQDPSETVLAYFIKSGDSGKYDVVITVDPSVKTKNGEPVDGSCFADSLFETTDYGTITGEKMEINARACIPWYGKNPDGETATWQNLINVVKITDSVTDLPAGLFYKSSLVKADFIGRSQVTVMPKGMFYECTSLVEAYFSPFLVEIGESAFRKCTSLNIMQAFEKDELTGETNPEIIEKKIVFPRFLEKIGKYAFKSTPMTVIDLSKTAIKSIGYQAFGNDLLDNGNSYIILPNNGVQLELLSDRAGSFGDSNGVIFVEGALEALDAHELYGYGINTYYLGGKFADVVKTIHGVQVIRATAQNPITVKSGIVQSNSEVKSPYALHIFTDGYIIVKATDTALTDAQLEEVLDFVIGEDGVKVRDNLVMIGAFAFYDCRELTGFTIPAACVDIGRGAFMGCSKLASVEIAADPQLKNISNLAFANTALTRFVLPSSLESVGSGVFNGCALSSVTLNSSVKYALGVNEDRTGNTREFYRGDGLGVLSGATGDLTVKIGSGVTDISANLFTGANTAGLRFDFSEATGLKTVGLSAFANSRGLTELDLTGATGLTTLEDQALSGVPDLKKVVIPVSVTSIGSRLFADCTKLETVIVNAAQATVRSNLLSPKNAAIKQIVLNGNYTYASDVTTGFLFYSTAGVGTETAPVVIIVGENVTSLPAGMVDIENESYFTILFKGTPVDETATTLFASAVYVNRYREADSTEAEAHDCQETTLDGLTVYHCDTCGKDYADTAAQKEIVSLHDHSIAAVTAKEKTCTEDGYKAGFWKCTTCGKFYSDEAGTTRVPKSDVIIPKGHELTHVEAKTATCTDNGNLEYWECTGTCWKLYKDENGQASYFTDEDVILPALGHRMQYTNTAANCGETAEVSYRCSVCDAVSDTTEAAHGPHDFSTGDTCGLCGAIRIAYGENVWVVLQANGDGTYAAEVTGTGTTTLSFESETAALQNAAHMELARYQITSLTFDVTSNVNSIGKYAFVNMPYLVTVKIPATVTNLTDADSVACFADCVWLREVELDCPYVPISMFADCFNLVKVTFGDHVTQLGSFLFQNCHRLSTIVLGKNIKKVTGSTLPAEMTLAEIYLPEGTASLDAYTASIIRLNLGNQYRGWDLSKYNALVHENRSDASIVHITDNGFIYSTHDGVTKLLGLRAVGETDVVLPQPGDLGCSGYIIASYAFSNYGIGSKETVAEPYALPYVRYVSLVIPDGVTAIQAYAFYCCAHLITVELPATPPAIAENAFNPGNTSATIEKIFTHMTQEEWDTYKGTVSSIGNFILEEGVEVYCGYKPFTADFDCASVGNCQWTKKDGKYIVLDGEHRGGTVLSTEGTCTAGVKTEYDACEICGKAYSKTVYGEHIWTAANVTTPDKCLYNVAYPRTCTVCNETGTGYTEVIGHTDAQGKVITSGKCAVCGKDVTSIAVGDGGVIAQLTDGNTVAVITTTGEGTVITGVTGGGNANESPMYQYVSTLHTVIVGDHITEVGRYFVAGMSDSDYYTNLTTVIIGKGVTAIKSGAFAQSYSVRKLVYNGKVTSVGSYASSSPFKNLGNPDGCDLYIGADVTAIPQYFFSNYNGTYICFSKVVFMGTACNSIGTGAFNVSTVEAVCYAGTAEEWGKITIGGSNAKLTGAPVYYFTDEEIENCTAVTGKWTYGSDGNAAILNGGHTFTKLTATQTAPTCTAPGVGTYECVVCGETQENAEIPVIPHDLDQDRICAMCHEKIPLLTETSGNCDLVVHLIDGKQVLYISAKPGTDGKMADYAYNAVAAEGCMETISEIVIQEGVTHIGKYAFQQYGSLVKVTIPSTVESIGNYAFYYCINLQSITIPAGVTSIGSYAFRNCRSLTAVTFDAPDHWHLGTSASFTPSDGDTVLTMNDAAQNATYLRSTYYNKYWKRVPTTEP